MLIQQVPGRVSDAWDGYKEILAESLVPTVVPDKEAMYKVLKAILLGDLTVWVLQDKEKAVGVLTTMFVVEPIAGQMNLLIYSFYLAGEVSPAAMGLASKQLKTYAEQNACRHIIFYVTDEKLKAVAQRYGFDVSITLGKLEV